MTSHRHLPHSDREEPLPQSSRQQLAQSLVLSVSDMMSQWARKATQAVSRKATGKDSCEWSGTGVSPGSARKTERRPAKRLLSNISSKAMSLVSHGRKRKGTGDGQEEEEEEDYEFDFGNGGVWQRTILMGDKCKPLDFSGAIHYDESGKQINHVPLRSPCTSPLPGYLARRMDSSA